MPDTILLAPTLAAESLSPAAITVLRSAHGRRCAKVFTRDADGGIGITPYDGERLWYVEVVPADNLATFTSALDILSGCRDRIIVRGALRDGIVESPVTRRCVGQDTSLRSAPRSWVALDVDGLDLGASVPLATPALVLATINRLPERFRNVVCWYQLTSSYGVNRPLTTMHVRLWFMLNHPVGDQAWKRALRPFVADSRIDLSLFNPVQPHFIAAPEFVNMPDPIAQRTGVIDLPGYRTLVDVADIPSREEADEGLVLAGMLTRTDVLAHPVQVANILDRFRTRVRVASRHSTAVAMIGELFGHGLSGEEAMRMTGRWMTDQGRAPERGELERALQFIQRRLAAGELRVNDTPISLLFDEETTEAAVPPPEAPATPEEAIENQAVADAVTAEWPTQPNSMARRAMEDLFGGDGYVRWGLTDYEWTGTYWRPFPDDEDLGARLQRSSGMTPTACERGAKALRNDRHRGFLNPPCRIEDGIAIAPRIVCENGWLSVAAVRLGTTPEVQPHTPLVFDTLPPMAVRYTPEATCPRFMRFLDECFDGDAESRGALVRLMGYLLFKGNEYQRVFICSGAPSSGKSTWLRVMRALLGPLRAAVSDLSELTADFGLQASYEAQVLFLPEASHGDRGPSLSGPAIDQLKRISGGDPVLIRRKYLNGIVAENLPTPVVICNAPPVIRDEAFVRRLVSIHFPHSFVGREDPTLTTQLITELPGIFNVALSGLAHLGHERDPFPPPAAAASDSDDAAPTAARALYEEIRADASPISEFLRECLTPTPNGPFISQSDLFDAYRRWCAQTHHPARDPRRFAGTLRMSLAPPMVWTRRRVPPVSGQGIGERSYGIANAVWSPGAARFRSDASGF